MESCQFGVVLTYDTAAGSASMLGLSRFSIGIKRLSWWSRAEPRPASTLAWALSAPPELE